jgi:hypothetical protein
MDFLSNYEDEDEEEETEKKGEFGIPFGLPTKFGGQLAKVKSQIDTFDDNDEIIDHNIIEKETFDNESDAYNIDDDDEIPPSPMEGKIPINDTDSFAVKYKIPVSHQVSLHHPHNTIIYIYRSSLIILTKILQFT